MTVSRAPDGRSPEATAASRLDQLGDALEKLSMLDQPAEAVARLADRLLPEGRVRDWASGLPLAHPLHPAAVGLPIGSLAAASWLDVRGGNRVAARRLIAFGLAGSVPALVSGVNDWLSTAEAERRVGLVHAVANATALLAYAASWRARRRGGHAAGVLLGLAGLGCLGAAGWLGGHLAYATGVGVDTTAFQAYPSEWTDVGAETDVPVTGSRLVHAEGAPVLVARAEGGEHGFVALAARCTHRGGPLTDGEIRDGCVTCPWHGSVFELSTGAVRRGPASRPQPVLQVRVADGRVQVRRPDEARALRLNPIS